MVSLSTKWMSVDTPISTLLLLNWTVVFGTIDFTPPGLSGRNGTHMKIRSMCKSNVRDAYNMAAAQWILINGELLLEYIRNAPHDGDNGEVPGPRYKTELSGLVFKKKSRELTLRRWPFWRDDFSAVASGERDHEKGSNFSQTCKEMSAKAAEKMELLERGYRRKKAKLIGLS